ncbi:hypothetical protein GFS31_24810 [Leptolyngbya sp. BL0902]|nr:hypothetical protein GFS31_24810 [Leptolyngbya sp. BL0902]
MLLLAQDIGCIRGSKTVCLKSLLIQMSRNASLGNQSHTG